MGHIPPVLSFIATYDSSITTIMLKTQEWFISHPSWYVHLSYMGHLAASCRPLPESTTFCWGLAHVVSLLPLGHIHPVASATSFWCPYACILHLLSLLHVAYFLSVRPQAAMIRFTAGTPTPSVQPAPETATTLASASGPQVRLARFTLRNQLLATPIGASFHSCVPTALSEFMLLLP